MNTITKAINIFTIHLSTKINGNIIIKYANNKILHFCAFVIALFTTKLSKFFLYNDVPLNHLSSFSELLKKHMDANNKNGVVGKTGNIIPINPNAKAKKPANI